MSSERIAANRLIHGVLCWLFISLLFPEFTWERILIATVLLAVIVDLGVQAHAADNEPDEEDDDAA